MHEDRKKTIDDCPTIEGWAVEAVQELQRQIDRLLTGRACKACRGAAEHTVLGRAGMYSVTCGECDGRGMRGAR